MVLRIILVLLLGGFAPVLLGDQQTLELSILHVNDSHGQTLGVSVNGENWGGYARLKTAVDQIRERNPGRVLLLHAGDEFSRGDRLTHKTRGQGNIALMNLVGFDLMTLGNGEFYIGAPLLHKRIGEARFTILASNVSYRTKDEPFALQTKIIEIAGVRIGFVGICFVRTEHPSALPLKVQDPIETARQLIPPLRQQCDLIVALNHLGLEGDRRLAEAVEGIDVIVGGHSHSTLPSGHRVTGANGQTTLIVQAGDQLRYLGHLTLALRQTSGKWTLLEANSQLIPLDSGVAENPQVKAAIARLWPANPTTRSVVPSP